MKYQWKRMLLTVLAILCLPFAAYPQTTGTIAGTVVDSTGAMVPDAAVRITNMATKDTRKSVSSTEGVFNVAGLVDGDYIVRIEAKGFKTWSVFGIHVLPGERKSIPKIALEIGEQTELIVVESDVAQIQTVDSGDRSSVLNSNALTNLGLEGRDVTELIRTMPGYADVSGGLDNKGADSQRTGILGGSSLANYSNQGTVSESGAADLVSDGARVIDPGCNCSATQTVNADMVAEVKVTTSAYSAENWHAPIVIQAIGKSGSSEYHGQVYMHYRNAGLNANDWYYKQENESRFPAQYEYPGGSIGGPVKIPHIHFNKKKNLVFWVGFEDYLQKIPDMYTGGLIKGNMPTVSERYGYVGSGAPLVDGSSSSLTNEANCAALSGSSAYASTAYLRCSAWNTLASDMDGTYSTPGFYSVGVTSGNSSYANIHPYLGSGTAAFLSQTPLPNRTPTTSMPYNYVENVATRDDGFMLHARVDYAVSDNSKLYIAYNRQNDNMGVKVGNYFTGSNPTVFPADAENKSRSNTAAGQFVKIFSPTLINEFNGSFAYGNIPMVYNKPDAITKSTLNFPFNLYGTSSNNVPFLYNTSIIDGPSIGFPDLQNYFSTKMTPSFSDTITKNVGKHSLKFGVNWQEVISEQMDYGYTTGPNGGLMDYGYTYLFQDPTHYTNEADANTSGLVQFLTDQVAYYSEQDNLGLDMGNFMLGAFFQDDWKVTPKLTFNYGLRVDHFSPWTDRSPNGNGMAAFTTGKWIADGGASAASGSTMPGVRTHTSDHDIPKSGRSLPTLLVSPRFGLAYDVFGTGKTVVRGGIGAYYYQDSYNEYSSALAEGNGYKTCSSTTGEYFGGASYYSSLASIAKGTGVTCTQSNSYNNTSYPSFYAVDPEDRKLPYTWTYNFAVSQRTYKNSVLEVAYQGSQTFDLPNPVDNINAIPLGAFFGGVANYDASTSPLKVYNIANSSTATKDSYRPMTNYTDVYLLKHGAWSNYNSLQITWSRMSGPLTYSVNYTWSKALGINSSYMGDPVNIHNDYGPLSNDRRHVLNATYSYKVGHLIKNNAIFAAVVNDWSFSGITQLQSGPDLQVNASVNYGLTGTDNTIVQSGTYESVNASYYLGSSDYNLMPIMTCSTPNSGGKSGQYMNPNCFKLPTPGDTSTQRYWFPYTKGPKFFNSDLTVARTFDVFHKQKMEIKASGFNFLNHPVPSFDSNNESNVTLDYTHGSLYTENVGHTNTKFGHRVMEFDFKYMF